LAEWVAIGIVKRPVGLDGFCSVEPYGETLSALRFPCDVRIGKEIAIAESAQIDKFVALPNGYRCKFNGRGDRTAVEGLRGSLIFIEQEALPELSGSSFYHFELKGMAVYSDAGNNRIGTVTEVHNYPSVDTIEVERTEGDSLLLPLTNGAIIAIDRAGKSITVSQSFVNELLL
jgi:16S rRNA processing protein RimM